jgi:small subunit ribosomal protein S16
MAVKIRLARHGKKNHAFFHIVVADVRAPRDGRFIEQIGSYNPNTNPATINLKGDRALYWLNCGAQPTDTCRRILSYEGILLKKHLEGGVKKGAITAEVAEQRFNAWKAEKDNKLSAKKLGIKEAKKASPRYKEIVEVTGGRLVPDWLEVDAEKLQGTVKELPSREQIDVPVNEMLIVELYSK